MKLVVISDTHGYHDHLTGKLPAGDVLIHCGDVSHRSDEQSVVNFAGWFDQQPFDHKICIAGNHDKFMSSKWFSNSIYLQDSECEIDGVRFWGSPWTPTFFDWYWMKDRGEEIAKVWHKIPDDVDVLITHGPPAGLGMLGAAGRHDSGPVDVGCENLRWKVDQVKPKVHCFGHIHEGYGITQIDETVFVNASYQHSKFRPVELTLGPQGLVW